jgi:hypothetical protein
VFPLRGKGTLQSAESARKGPFGAKNAFGARARSKLPRSSEGSVGFVTRRGQERLPESKLLVGECFCPYSFADAILYCVPSQALAQCSIPC